MYKEVIFSDDAQAVLERTFAETDALGLPSIEVDQFLAVLLETAA